MSALMRFLDPYELTLPSSDVVIRHSDIPARSEINVGPLWLVLSGAMMLMLLHISFLALSVSSQALMGLELVALAILLLALALDHDKPSLLAMATVNLAASLLLPYFSSAATAAPWLALLAILLVLVSGAGRRDPGLLLWVGASFTALLMML